MMTARCTAVRRDDAVTMRLLCGAELSEVCPPELRGPGSSRFLDAIAENLTLRPEGP